MKPRVESRNETAEIDGARIAYSDTGRGLPLLCLHGGMGIDGRTLRVPGILDLAQRGVRVIIPDQRGHGASARGKDREYTHATWSADARGLVRHLRLREVALLGHSYGGFIALEYAVRWAEWLTHLVLVSTSAGPVMRPATKFLSDGELREHFRARWPQLFAGEEKHWKVFEEARFSAPPHNAAFARELPAYDVRDRIAGLRVPMLLVVGADDPYRKDMEWLAEEASSATLHVVAEVGHFPFLEAPSFFADVVSSFLAGAV
jgi:pimeloyl-ACP methyl ester carboxylesterase